MGRNRDSTYSRSRSRSGSLSSSSSGRAVKARDWNGEGGYRLHLSDLAIGVGRRDIEKLFRPYGPLNEVWVASNPPCFAFINFRDRTGGERALKELDGKIVGGSRIGLRWARPRNFGGRSTHTLPYRSPSLARRRGYRDSYYGRRDDDRYSRRRYASSRSRSPSYRRSRRSYRRRSSNSGSRSRTRSPSPQKDIHREKHSKKSRIEIKQRRSESVSTSDSVDNGSSYRKNEKRISRSSSTECHPAISSNGDDHIDTDNHHVFN